MIKLGVIGTGAVVYNLHWPVLQQLSDDVQVVAVASRNRRNAARFAKLAGATHIDTDYRRLLENRGVDAILTAVPIALNGAVLIDAIRSGKHVLAEKPIAATPQEARRILKECSKHGSVVAVGENFRYRSDVIKAKRLLSQGKIGVVFAFQINVKFDLSAEARRLWTSQGWRKKPSHPGGILLDAGVHPIAALRDLLGEVVELDAYISDVSPVLKGPDSLLVQLKLKSGVIGQCFFCFASKEQKEDGLDFAIYGTRGSLRLSDMKVAWSRRVAGPYRVYAIPQFDRGYLGQWKNFIAAIRGKTDLVSTPEKAYGDLLVLSTALRSARSARRLQLK